MSTNKSKIYPKINDDTALDNVLNDPGLTPDELNSVMYKNDFKKFRENLSKDVSKYHKLETWYGKLFSFLSTLTWFLGFLSFVLSGVDAIMSSMISNNNNNNTSLTQDKFNYSMLVTNWLDIIFLIVVDLIQILNNRIQGNINKHTAHKTKSREYLNILTTNFDKAYSDKIITADEMQEMSTLQNKYEAEQLQISLSGQYYTSSTTSIPNTNTPTTSVQINDINSTPFNPVLNDQQISFLKILENMGKNTPAVV